MSNYGQKIKQLRELKGISQKQVADEAGIKPSSYFNIENGKTQSISIEVGKGIARALDVAFNELFEIETKSDHYKNERIKELEDEVVRLTAALKKEEKVSSLLTEINASLEKEKFRIIINGEFEEIYNVNNQIEKTQNPQQKKEYLIRIESIKRVLIDQVREARKFFFKSDIELFKNLYSQDPTIFKLIQSSDNTDIF